MRIILIMIDIIFLILLSSCYDGQNIIQSDQEKINEIKHEIIRDGPGYNYSILIIDSATIKYYAQGNDYTPSIDTIFTISASKWNQIINSFEVDKFMELDTSYIGGMIEGFVILSIITDNRSKKIRFSEGKKIQYIDSLNKILYRIREEL